MLRERCVAGPLARSNYPDIRVAGNVAEKNEKTAVQPDAGIWYYGSPLFLRLVKGVSANPESVL